ncbi:MAG: C40 family peptidase [Bacteroidales bacterium]|nr:C40 family peptidase [Bacteroidales bacterium]
MQIKYYVLLLCASLILVSCSATKPKSNKPSHRLNQITIKPNEETIKQNDALFKYYQQWLGTPYKLGGLTKEGVDCSGFVYNVYLDLYGITLPRRSSDMISAVLIIDSKDSLQRGDIVFFQNSKKRINHVGIYLQDKRFIHSSSSNGVIISSIEETYWKQHYRCGGRLKTKGINKIKQKD